MLSNREGNDLGTIMMISVQMLAFTQRYCSEVFIRGDQLQHSFLLPQHTQGVLPVLLSA